MERIIPKDFKFQLYELVDPYTFKSRGVAAWSLLRQDALDALHGLRTFINVPITINNWFSGGSYEWSGYRSPACTLGAQFSQHRYGNAFDCKFKDMTAEEARQIILKNQDSPLLQKIMRLEADTVGWVHIDAKPVENRIYVFHA